MYKLTTNKVPTAYSQLSNKNHSINKFSANYYKSSEKKDNNNYYNTHLVQNTKNKVNHSIGYDNQLDLKGCYYGCKN